MAAPSRAVPASVRRAAARSAAKNPIRAAGARPTTIGARGGVTEDGGAIGDPLEGGDQLGRRPGTAPGQGGRLAHDVDQADEAGGDGVAGPHDGHPGSGRLLPVEAGDRAGHPQIVEHRRLHADDGQGQVAVAGAEAGSQAARRQHHEVDPGDARRSGVGDELHAQAGGGQDEQELAVAAGGRERVADNEDGVAHGRRFAGGGVGRGSGVDGDGGLGPWAFGRAIRGRAPIFGEVGRAASVPGSVGCRGGGGGRVDARGAARRIGRRRATIGGQTRPICPVRSAGQQREQRQPGADSQHGFVFRRQKWDGRERSCP